MVVSIVLGFLTGVQVSWERDKGGKIKECSSVMLVPTSGEKKIIMRKP